MMIDEKRVHIYVSGIVQGVFFRANAVHKAEQLGITGWVKNLPDGRVELIAEGEADRVDRMVSWCKTGSPGSTVKRVDVEVLPCRDEFKGFRIAY